MFRNQLAVLSLFATIALVVNQDVEPEYVTQFESKLAIRVIPADILRDHPNKCFASTDCKTYDIDDSWLLTPYCGRSRCKLMEDEKTQRKFLLEEVQDCGPAPHVEPRPTGKVPPCKVDLTRFNSTGHFPACCPVYVCAEGYSVKYPDLSGENPPPQNAPGKPDVAA